MQAVICHAPHDLRVEEYQEPEIAADPGTGQVRVRIETGGICGSDLHYYHDGGFGTVRIKEPLVLGHEVSGIIETLGTGVKGLRQGERVAVSPSQPCNVCKYCLAGQQVHCLDMRFFGSAMRMPHVQGAFRQHITVSADQCFAVLPSVTAGEAAMAEPLAVCLHAVNRAGPLVGKRVLITGAGPIGAICAIAARRAGATEIVATDIAAQPLQTVERLGVDLALNVASNADALKPFTVDKGHFDVLFEASGQAAALVGALDALRPRGIIVQVGLGGDMELPVNTFVTKEFDLRGTFRFHTEFATAVEMLNSGLIDVSPLISATIPYVRAVEAFEMAGDRSRAMKVQLAFS